MKQPSDDVEVETRASGVYDRTDLAGYGPERAKMRMAITIPRAIMNTVGALPPESGGFLGGPKDSDDITEFYLDKTGAWDGKTYTPDHEAINRVIKRDWKPRGLDLKGAVHSHPDGYTNLSPGDLDYINRIFECNPDMKVFMAPLVIPSQFRIRPFIVRRGKHLIVEEAILEVFEANPTTDARETQA